MEWWDEKKALLATIQRQEQEAVALARRFKLLQQTLKEQQKLLDRYQRALGAVEAKSRSSAAKPKRSTTKKTAIIKPIVHRSNSGLASTWAEEKRRMLKKSKWEQMLGLAALGTSDKESFQVEQTSDRPKSFAYIEVVRNREERKALLGHDCIECKKYYDALGEIGTIDAAAQKHKCSRHRARFEPYQTPDDFWRLSFPDSEPQ
ncbi:unnamed protein product [Peronospora destructor]|uniref:DNA endonuclease activator Ctp1 C-terminal domain-containing protein n=1 Tax=Peronospora destructor TaxID=86335 RepID=A0AAV0SVF1_9STRA|nr:unnamed protein product [Peronospora destructor]